MKKRILILISVLVFIFTGCSNGNGDKSSETQKEDKNIKIGVVSGFTAAQVLDEAKKELEENGYKIEVVEFTDYVTPNMALDDGSIDYNFYQHIPFLESFNEEKGTDLVHVGDGVYNVSYGVYSEKLESIDDIKEGMQVAIQEDSSNRARSLKILEDADIIKLKEGVEIPTVLDIEENPYELEFIEMGELHVIKALKDVDLGCVSNATYQEAGKDPTTALLSHIDEISTMVLVTTKENQDSDVAKDINDALTNQKMIDFMEENYKGVVYPVGVK